MINKYKCQIEGFVQKLFPPVVSTTTTGDPMRSNVLTDRQYPQIVHGP